MRGVQEHKTEPTGVHERWRGSRLAPCGVPLEPPCTLPVRPHPSLLPGLVPSPCVLTLRPPCPGKGCYSWLSPPAGPRCGRAEQHHG